MGITALICDRSPTAPIILIGGLNGGGKTTLMDALRLVLYGQRAPIDRRRNLAYADFLTQCVNTQAPPTAPAAIALEFEHLLYTSGIEKLGKIRVTRTWYRGTKDDLTVELDGWPNEILTQTWDEQVEAWLPVGLSNLFLFDGEQVKELAEQETPPPNVVSAIRAVLGLALVDRLAQDLTILVSRKKAELGDEATQQALHTLSNQIEQVEIDLNLAADAHQAHEAACNQAITALQAAEAHTSLPVVATSPSKSPPSKPSETPTHRHLKFTPRPCKTSPPPPCPWPWCQTC
jgi:DNA sulfur modification protein DndD